MLTITAASTPGNNRSRSSRRNRIKHARPSPRVHVTPASLNIRVWYVSVDRGKSSASSRLSCSNPSASRRIISSRVGSLKAPRTLVRDISSAVGWWYSRGVIESPNTVQLFLHDDHTRKVAQSRWVTAPRSRFPFRAARTAAPGANAPASARCRSAARPRGPGRKRPRRRTVWTRSCREKSPSLRRMCRGLRWLFGNR